MLYVFLDDEFLCIALIKFFIQLLVALKVCFPQRITILRGNHESRQVYIFLNFSCGILYSCLALHLYCQKDFLGILPIFSVCNSIAGRVELLQNDCLYYFDNLMVS